jgi:hypothetical protein
MDVQMLQFETTIECHPLPLVDSHYDLAILYLWSIVTMILPSFTSGR